MVKICLPNAENWVAEENFASNLRMSASGACVPVGSPKTLLADSGTAAVVMPSGNILTVGSDYRTLSLNGANAGTLAAPFLTALTEGVGDEAIVFTTAGPEWFAEGACQGVAPNDLCVEITAEAQSADLTATVVCPDLVGTYSRLSCEMTAADRSLMADAVNSALESIADAALAQGRLVQPAWVAWRMIDIDGRTVAVGSPQRVGSIQGNSTLLFTATKTDTSFTATTSATLSLTPYQLQLTVGRTASDFWRSRVARIEIAVWHNCAELSGVAARFDEVSSDESSLSVTPVMVETARSGSPTLSENISEPLEGLAVELTPEIPDEQIDWDDNNEPQSLIASVAYRSGTLTAYALSGEIGMLAVAASSNPLIVAASCKICPGKILRISTPVGSAGGWNYGRQHLLAFSTDGIYSVSIDSKMQTISSSLLLQRGIARADAVAITPTAVYVADKGGALLRLRGSKVETVTAPIAPVAIGWSNRFLELWLIDSNGAAATIDSNGRVSLRTDVALASFVNSSMAVDSAGALRNLDSETECEMTVEWCQRTPIDWRAGTHNVEWHIDSAKAENLTLTLLCDSGGTPQRVLELVVNGEINAPICARFRAPRRRWLTVCVKGSLTHSSRLFRAIIG